MNYRLDKYGNKLSVLGFGCMRFQQKMGKIDMEKAEQQIMTAFQNGVNYYDTAYIYSGSEAAIHQSGQCGLVAGKAGDGLEGRIAKRRPVSCRIERRTTWDISSICIVILLWNVC